MARDKNPYTSSHLIRSAQTALFLKCSNICLLYELYVLMILELFWL